MGRAKKKKKTEKKKNLKKKVFNPFGIVHFKINNYLLNSVF